MINISHTTRTLILALGMTQVGFAQGRDVATFEGHLLDAVCAKNHATETGYKEKHEKTCSLMDVCVKSGFALVTADNRVLTFDEKGNQLALDLIKKTEREKDWKVSVSGAISADTISVATLRLR
jgi:hypothetical protein